MKHFRLSRLVSALVLLVSRSVFAVDGQVLINQTTITNAGGFPYRITAPGSYKLSGNLVVPNNFTGIRIESNGVSLDLNGFNITCSASQPGGSEEQTCIDTNNAAVNSLSIRNGSITVTAKAPTFNFNSISGLFLLFASGATVEDIHFHGQATNYNVNGLVGGSNSIIRRNTFTGSASPSISCPSVVQDNMNGTGGSGSGGSGCVAANNAGTFTFF